METRSPDKHKPSHSRRLKTEHRKALKLDATVSLKKSVRDMMSGNDSDVASFAKDWFHNKRANVSNPPQRIGRTNRIKKK